MEEGHGPSQCQLPCCCPINHSVTVQLGIPDASATRSPRNNGIISGGRGCLGQGLRRQYRLPSISPSAPSACGVQGLVAEQTRVTRGWQGLAGLIQLAGPPLPPRNSGPTGAQLQAAVLCAGNPYIWIQTLPFRDPHPSSHLGLIPRSRRQRWPPQKSWGTGSLWAQGGREYA